MGGERARRSLRRVSVIIPALDEAEWLPGLLADLGRQTLRPHEVIVVDGGSADATAGIAEAAGARVVRSARRGIALQRNAGAAVATGDLLVFADADVRLGARMLERLARSMDRRRLDAACPLFWPWPGDAVTRAFFAAIDAVFVATAPLLPSGGGMMIAVRRTTFALFGGFDEGYRFEDVQFIRRVGALGRYRVALVPAFVSDRRFRRDGRLRTIATYTLLGTLFALGLLRLTNRVGYRFGSYGGPASP